MVDTKADEEEALRTWEGVQVEDTTNPIVITIIRKIIVINQAVEVAEPRR